MNTDQQNDRLSNKSDLLFVILYAGMILLTLFLASLFVVLGISTISYQNSAQTISFFSLAAGTFGIGVLLLPGFILIPPINRLFPTIKLAVPVLNDFFLLAGMLFAWLACLYLGQLFLKIGKFSILVIPVINFLAVALPIAFFLRISLRKLEMPSLRQGWSVFGASLIIPPAISMILESLAFGFVFLVFLIFLGFAPDLRNLLMSYINTFNLGSQNEKEAMQLTANILFTPGVSPIILGVLSVIIPLIEESLKVLMIFPLLNKIQRPVDGFVLGTLCGAAFAFTENIGFVSAGTDGLLINAALRATASLPHMLNSGILGWGIVSAWRCEKIGPFFTAFLSVVLIHGVWNAVSLGLALNDIAFYINTAPGIFQNDNPWVIAWAILAIGSFIGLIFNNRRMRNHPE